ncbi:MAG TPA: DUF2953 domain-containing protein [Methanomicrobia archaeon]|nr:DUF2953 domain-containing protein [Methanomicrobia archaeon]
MTLALVLLVIFALSVLLSVATLLIPASISIRLLKEGPIAEVILSLGLLLGALTGHVEYRAERHEFRACILGRTVFRRPLERRTADKTEEKKQEKRENAGTDWATMITNADELYSAAKELVRTLTRHLSVKRASDKLVVGLPDAAETGMLTGALYAGRGIATAAFPPAASIEIAPSFHEEKLDTEVAVELSLPLVTIIAPVIRFLWRMRKIFRTT